MKSRIKISITSLAFVITASVTLYAYSANAMDETSAKPWFQKVQVYNMVAFPKKDVKKYNITINGLWNGYIGEFPSPFAFARMMLSKYSGKTYNSDKEFVDDMHSQNLICPATILTSQGHRLMQGEDLENLACRSAEGELPDFDPEAGSVFMCSSKPGWKTWMIQHGKKAIDSGADLIVLDEIQGNSFYAMFQLFFYYSGMKEPGFCNYCIEGLRNYLKKKFTIQELKSKFNISDIEKEDLRQRIADTKSLFYKDRIAADPLVEVYIDFQEEKNFKVKKKVVKTLKNYARKQGKEVSISANSFAIGTPRSGGYWVKGLIYSDFLDFYTFENTYTAFDDVNILSFPRNKWLAWEKLARAATGSPAVILPDTGAIEEIVTNSLGKGQKYSNYLYILFAEAYANLGAFVNYYIKIWSVPGNWEGCAAASKFVLNNRNLYEAESETGAEIGMLYLQSEAMRQQVYTYLGFAQALAESNIPYDVIFGGGGKYLKDRLKLARIKHYKLIIIPSADNITSNQKKTIKKYVRTGGKAIIFDPEVFGIEGTGEIAFGKGSFHILPTYQYQGEDWNTASSYFFDYKKWQRKNIADAVKAALQVKSMIDDTERKVIAYPYYQENEKRVVVHLVNYDHEMKTDKVTSRTDLKVRVKKPDFPLQMSAYVISPDFEGQITVETSIQDGYIEIKIPLLMVYNVVVIE